MYETISDNFIQTILILDILTHKEEYQDTHTQILVGM